MLSAMRHLVAITFIRIGFAILDPDVKAEFIRMMGIAGRKGII